MIWHWQQYLTCGVASAAVVIFILNILLQDRASDKLNSFLQLGLISFGQFVLWSGGWYS